MKESIKILLESILGLEMMNQDFFVENTGVQQRDVLYFIYTRRSQYSNKVQPELLERMRNFDEHMILIMTIRFNQKSNLLFCSESIKHFIGLIDLDKEHDKQ